MKLYTEKQVREESITTIENKDSLKDKLFNLANEFAVAGYGQTAVVLHTIHNGFDVNEKEYNNRK